MLLYPLDTGTTIYLYDGRADAKVAQILYLLRGGGLLLPIPPEESAIHGNHSSDEYWDQFSRGESPPRRGEPGYHTDDDVF